MKTGELVAQTWVAANNGLLFKLTPSPSQAGKEYCSINGSLHRYHNQGANNANDFSHADLCNVISALSEHFHLRPSQSIIRGLEFGINVSLPVSAQSFLRGVVCLPDKPFAPLNIEPVKVKVGWICQRSEYALKIYDKGKQSGTPVDNLVRVELKVSKMRWLEPIGIYTLADLTDKGKLARLGELLVSQFSEVIFYDRSIPLASLTQRERLKLEQFTNPIRWKEGSRQTRYKMRRKMNEFMIRHGATDTMQNALCTIQKKWLEMLNEPQKKGDDFTMFKSDLTAHERVTISPLECTVNTSPITTLNKGQFFCPQFDQNPPLEMGGAAHQNQRTFCPECGRDISRQKVGSKFCSETLFGKSARRCRDKSTTRKRTQQKQATRQMEVDALNYLVALFPTARINLSIERRGADRCIVCDWQTLPTLLPLEWRKVCRVSAQLPDGNYKTLTTKRAKDLIKFLNLQTISNGQRKAKRKP